MDAYLTSFFFESSVVNVIMYIVLLIILGIVIWVEVHSTLCPQGFMSKNCQMSATNGVFTHGTTASSSDSCADVVEKTQKATTAFTGTVKWRIAFILGVFIAIILWIFIFQILPHWVILYLTVLISFLIIYFYFNFAGFHISNGISSIINNNLEILGKKCK